MQTVVFLFLYPKLTLFTREAQVMVHFTTIIYFDVRSSAAPASLHEVLASDKISDNKRSRAGEWYAVESATILG